MTARPNPDTLAAWSDLLARLGGRYELARAAWLHNYGTEPPCALGQQAEAEHQTLEAEIQTAILAYLRGRGWIAWHADSGSKTDPANRRAKAGRPPIGWPDVQAYGPNGQVFLLEVKRPGQKLRPDQEITHARLRALGQRVMTVHSLDEAMTATEGP